MFLIPPHTSIAKLRHGKASLIDRHVNLLPSAMYISIIVLLIHQNRHRLSTHVKNITRPSGFRPIHMNDGFKVINELSYHHAKLRRTSNTKYYRFHLQSRACHERWWLNDRFSDLKILLINWLTSLYLTSLFCYSVLSQTWYTLVYLNHIS